MLTPTLDEFKRLAEKGNLIPVYREILADLETPVSAFKKIAQGEYAYLLESVEKGEKIGRYSFLGSEPQWVCRVLPGHVVVRDSTGEREFRDVANPLHIVRDHLKRFRPVRVEGVPRFHGGAVGVMGYDFVRYFEKVPDSNPDDLGLPEGLFIITDTILAFDHLRHKILIISNAFVDGAPEPAYREAEDKINRLVSRLHSTRIVAAAGPTRSGDLRIESNMTKAEYCKAAQRAKEYVHAGDVIQVQISQRLEAAFEADPFDVYRALRTVNPSPYMYYLHFENFRVAGSSPELLVRAENGLVETRPIAGTRWRGRTSAEDREMEAELLGDPKERAEHVMLVDLGRNDLGRVSRHGTVEVDEFMLIERYSHVMHIVSNVRGQLGEGLDAFDVLQAGFPAGTVTGSPKIRAMEIIDELEKVRRGIYAGAVGYFDYGGNIDSAIAIRTIILAGGRAYAQAAAGIVADSIPEREHLETMNKTRALVRALELAQAGLDR